MAIVAVSIAPAGVGPSMAGYVAEAVRVLERQQRVHWELGPMFTTLEGDLPDIFELLLEMREAVFAAGAARVGMVIKTDERRDRPASASEKVARVREALRRDPGGA